MVVAGAPLPLGHRIEAERIAVRVAREELARRLIARLGELNRARLLPAIERVFDEVDRPDEWIRIDRLDLDLGRIGEADLGQIEGRLERALRAALDRALRGRTAPQREDRSEPAPVLRRPVGTALADLFGHWLDRGSWPYAAVIPPGTHPSDLLAELIETAPEALVTILRRRAGSEQALRRLVRQIDGPRLEALLGLLDPASAGWILAYMAETRAAHAEAPLVEATPDAFGEELWLIVLRDALHRAGLRANRRAFVGQLVAGVAERFGIAWADLVRALQRALAELPAEAMGDASLLSILAEISAEGPPAAARTGPALDDAAATAAPPAHDLLAVIAARLAAAAPADESLAMLLRQAADSDAPALARLLRRLAAESPEIVGRLAAAAGIAGAAAMLLPPHLGAVVAGIFETEARGDAERMHILEAASALPHSAPAVLAVERLTTLLAQGRDEAAPALLARLRARAESAGGAARARLVPAIDDLLESDRWAERRVRRERALDLLRAQLSGTAAAGLGELLARSLPALAGIGSEELRRALAPAVRDPAVRDPAASVAALRALGPASLRRLIALLAPRRLRGSERLRARLAAAGDDSGALALLATELIVRGEPGPAGAEPRAKPRLPALEDFESAALRLVEEALKRGRFAAESRRALAFLLRRRPAELVRLLAERRRIGARLSLAASSLATELPGLSSLGGALLGADAAIAAVLFERLPAGERRDAEALARRLTGPAGRSGLSAETLAIALSEAVAAALLARRARPFAELWAEALRRVASPRERTALEQLLGAEAGKGRGPVAPAPPLEPEPGSAAWFAEALAAGPAGAARIARLLRSAAVRRRLARRMPRHLLVRLLFAVRPREASALLAVARLASGISADEGALSADDLWEALLDSARARPGEAVARLAERLTEGRGRATLAALLAEARALGQSAFAEALDEVRALRRAPSPPHPSTRLGDEGGEPILVLNAGLVLAAPYFPALFERVGLAAPDDEGRLAWVVPEAAGRGVHLLQYLVDGRTDSPEPLLALNKLLCGLDPSWPALARIEMSDEERETCDSLLAAVIENWPLLQGSSVAALRETFLQREGRLARAEGGWKLDVERKTVDVLVDGIPWSFAMILAPWMPEPLAVAW
jgi:hypothetical protein